MIQQFLRDALIDFSLTETRFAPVSNGEEALRAVDASACALFDFGEECVGDVHFSVQCESATTVQLFYGEDEIEARRDADYSGEWYFLPRDEFHLAPGTHEITNQGRRAFRWVRVQIESGELQVLRAQAISRHYEVERRGKFHCPDDLLNRAWDISERTTRLCMQQWYEDGIKRDALLWIGDYRWQYLCNATLYADVALARKSLAMMALSQFPDGSLPACAVRGGAHQHGAGRNIAYMFELESDDDGFMQNWVLANYISDWVSCVREFYLYSGDRDFAIALWPTTQSALQWLTRFDLNAAKPGHDFITDVQPDVPDSWSGFRGAMAAQLLWAARDGLWLSEQFGDDAQAALCRELIEKSRRQLDGFFDADSQLFKDEMAENSRVGWHVNSLAVLAGALPDDEARLLLQRIADAPNARRPLIGFMQGNKLWAQCEQGLMTEALQSMRDYWGHMLRFDATTCWDACDISNTAGIDRPDTHAMSHCHGWSASPAWLLPSFVLGVRPAAPGWKHVSIRPQLGDLEWAQGVVPTPHGDIFARWERAENGVRGHVTLPPGISGEVILQTPYGESRREITSGESHFNRTELQAAL